MNLRKMRVFKEAAADLHFTKTAQKLHMTQPAVSHVIREMEEELNVRLFERIGKKVYLTDAGTTLLHKINQLLELYDHLDQRTTNTNQVPVRIGATITVGNFWLLPWLHVWRQKYPATPLKISVDRASNIEEKLFHNEIDIAILEGVVHYRQLVTKKISTYGLSIFCSRNHPFAKEKKVEITPKEFISQPLLLREQGSATRDIVDSVLQLSNLYVDPVVTSVSPHVLIEATKSNLGITVLPDLLLEEEMQKRKLVKLSIKGRKLRGQIYVCHHRNKFISQSMKDFIRICQEMDPLQRN